MPGLPRPTLCAAVALTARNGSGCTYKNAMSVVRRAIKLSELGIAEVRARKAVAGALIFEIAGQDASSKASRLAERMARDLRDFPAKVIVPRRNAELRVTGLEDSIISVEVAATVAEAGHYQAAVVSVGVISAAPRGLVSVWLRYPLTAARKIGGSSGGRGDTPPGGKLHIGWSAARISHLPAH
jgi:hypothetical protein